MGHNKQDLIYFNPDDHVSKQYLDLLTAMRILAVKLILLLYARAIVSPPATQDMQRFMSTGDFKSHIATGCHLIMFTAENCSFCDSLLQVFESIKENKDELDRRHPGISAKLHFDVVGCSDALDICFGEEIYEAPAIVLYHNSSKVAVLPISSHNRAGIYQLLAIEARRISIEPALASIEAHFPLQEALDSRPNKKGQVVELTDASFMTSIAQGVWFVDFFAPWCHYCREIAPLWKDLAVKLEGVCNVASVDCTENPVLCQKLGINGFPTLKFFKDGAHEDYWGNRSAEALLGHALDKSKASTPYITSELFDILVKEPSPFLVYYYQESVISNEADTTVIKLWRMIHKSLPFYFSRDLFLMKALVPSELPALFLVSNQLPEALSLPATADIELLNGFVNDIFKKLHQGPIPLTSANAELLLTTARSIFMTIFSSAHASCLTTAAEVSSMDGLKNIRSISVNAEEFPAYVDRLFGKSPSLPRYIFLDTEKELYAEFLDYAFLSSDTIAKFLRDCVNRRIALRPVQSLADISSSLDVEPSLMARPYSTFETFLQVILIIAISCLLYLFMSYVCKKYRDSCAKYSHDRFHV